MKKTGILCVIFLLGLILPTHAENTFDTFDQTVQDFEPEVAHNPDFDEPADELANVVQAIRPKCDSPEFQTKILETARQTLNENKASSILAKRHKAIVLRGLQDFEEVSAVLFSPETDVNTANALITLKINRRIRPEDIIVCRQKNAKETPVYVVIYPFAGGYKGYILNLIPNVGDFERVSFDYL